MDLVLEVVSIHSSLKLSKERLAITAFSFLMKITMGVTLL